jgi:hypothetical protein
MPRDINGNYTLPAGNPVVSHETIESNWANTTFPDIAQALTNSLSRNGNGGMLVPFRFVDGTVNAPGITFQNEPTSGIYRAGLNDIRLSLITQDIIKFALGGVTIPGGKTLTVSGLLTASGGVAVTGGITLTGGITAGSIDGTPIGGTTPSTGAFTTLTSTGGALNGSIGATTPAAGTFTSLTSTGPLTAASATITGALSVGAITGTSLNGTPIGNITPSTGVFTTLSALGSVNAALGTPTNAGGFQLGRRDTGSIAWTMYSSAGNLQWYDNTADRWTMSTGPSSIFSGPILSASITVVTPLVQSSAGQNLILGASAGNDWAVLATGKHYVPTTDNTQDAGASANRIRTGYFGTSVVSPFITAAAGQQVTVRSPANGGLLLGAHGTDYWQLYDGASPGLLYPLADNAYDIGKPANRIRTGYFGASIVLGLVGVASGSSIDIVKDSLYNNEQGGLYQRTGLGGGNVGLLMGTDKAAAVAWIQSTEPSTSYTSKSLALNPNGGAVRVNGISGNVLTLGATTIDTLAAPLSLQSASTGQMRVGTVAATSSQTAAILSARATGNAFEFGHTNGAGYGSTLGCEATSGKPGVFLCCELDGGNTYRTRGNAGTVIQSDLSGGLVIGKVANVNAAGQSLTPLVTISAAGLLTAVGGFSSGSGLAPAFESAEQAATVSLLYTLPHGLGRLPKLCRVVLRNKIAEGGYAPGEEAEAPFYFAPGTGTFGLQLSADATNLYVMTAPSGCTVENKTLHNQHFITTAANWRAVAYAW